MMNFKRIVYIVILFLLFAGVFIAWREKGKEAQCFILVGENCITLEDITYETRKEMCYGNKLDTSQALIRLVNSAVEEEVLEKSLRIEVGEAAFSRKRTG